MCGRRHEGAPRVAGTHLVDPSLNPTRSVRPHPTAPAAVQVWVAFLHVEARQRGCINRQRGAPNAATFAACDVCSTSPPSLRVVVENQTMLAQLGAFAARNVRLGAHTFEPPCYVLQVHVGTVSEYPMALGRASNGPAGFARVRLTDDVTQVSMPMAERVARSHTPPYALAEQTESPTGTLVGSASDAAARACTNRCRQRPE